MDFRGSIESMPLRRLFCYPIHFVCDQTPEWLVVKSAELGTACCVGTVVCTCGTVMLVHLHTLLLQHKGQHTSTHIHTHTCTHTRAHTHMHIHMHIHTHRRTEEVTDRSCCEIFAGKIYFSLVIFLAHADCFLV